MISIIWIAQAQKWLKHRKEYSNLNEVEGIFDALGRVEACGEFFSVHIALIL